MPSGRGNQVARLSMIEEDGVPEIEQHGRSKQRASHRPFSRRWKDEPPRPSFEAPPPDYNVWDSSISKRVDLRNRQWLVKRGGWKRLLLFLVVAIAIALGLGIGLGVGLTKRAQYNSPPSSTAHTAPSDEEFPIGSYAFPVFLTSTSSNCTALPSTWRCYPYMTYSSTSDASLVPFDWVIASSDTVGQYMVSSSKNPFAPSFANASLTLQQPGSEDEHYQFSVPLEQYIVPSSPITDDNLKVGCYFNHTSLVADLYTRKKSERVPENSTSAGSGSQQTWPFAVQVTQSISGGQDVPNCYQFQNGNMGVRVTAGLDPRPSQDVCECLWKNFDLDGS